MTPLSPISYAAPVQRFARAAEKLVSATSGGASDDDAGQAMVEMKEARAQLKAEVAVQRASDDMLGALLDITV